MVAAELLVGRTVASGVVAAARLHATPTPPLDLGVGLLFFFLGLFLPSELAGRFASPLLPRNPLQN
jgi:hypothetical protein